MPSADAATARRRRLHARGSSLRTAGRRELFAPALPRLRLRGLRLTEPRSCEERDEHRRERHEAAGEKECVHDHGSPLARIGPGGNGPFGLFGRRGQPLRCSVNSASFPLSAFSSTPERSGSWSIACVIFFACSKVMCGGSGGTSGSVFTWRTTGRSAASASSQAERIASPESQKIPFNPQSSAYAA